MCVYERVTKSWMKGIAQCCIAEWNGKYQTSKGSGVLPASQGWRGGGGGGSETTELGINNYP